MQDFLKAKGIFRIELIRDGEVIDSYGEDNLIMYTGRQHMGQLLSGISNTKIDKIVLGTRGHFGGDLLNPRDETEGYVPERTRLFSEAYEYTSGAIDVMVGDTVKDTNTGNFYEFIGTADLSNYTPNFSDTARWNQLAEEPYNYSISFTPALLGGNLAVTGEGPMDSAFDDPYPAVSTVNVTHTDTTVSYVIDLPAPNGNKSTGVAYTEAAFYAGDNIFNMKCFNGKIKDNTVQLRVKWDIVF